MSDRKVRMGIDVGGTHTKAVAIDNATHEIIGKSSVKTTHDDKAGVATGVVQAFQNCLRENGIDPKDVIFVARLFIFRRCFFLKYTSFSYVLLRLKNDFHTRVTAPVYNGRSMEDYKRIFCLSNK